MMRIILFLVTNMAVMLLFGMVMLFVNVQCMQLSNLLFISFVVGFSGSIVSLLMSKYLALLAINGKVLQKITTDELENWLLSIVCKQAIQLGILMPQVVIYDAIDMNAFATGARKDSALIAVSTGLLQNMNRDEIEAVVAHEMSHISNGDMVTMALIQGVINTFVIFISRILAQFIARCISTFDNENSSEDMHVPVQAYSESNSSIYLFISMILESVFGIFANMITLWFSRHREFYADAGSAKLVGCDKMIAALQKLKLSCVPQESNAVMSFCINGKKTNGMFTELFMSHPPLDKRIQALRCGYYLDKSSLFHQ